MTVTYYESKQQYRGLLPRPENMMWLECPGSNQDIYLTFPRSRTKFDLTCTERDEMGLFFEGSKETLGVQFQYQGPMMRIAAAVLRTKHRIQDFVSTVCFFFFFQGSDLKVYLP